MPFMYVAFVSASILWSPCVLLLLLRGVAWRACSLGVPELSLLSGCCLWLWSPTGPRRRPERPKGPATLLDRQVR